MACTLMSTMPGRTSGLGTSARASTSGPPVCAKTIAFISDSLEDVRPFFQHLGMPVPDADGEVVVAGGAQLPEALAQLGRGGGEGQRANQVGGADLVLFRPQDHQVAAVIGQVAGVRRLVRLVDLLIALGQVRQLRGAAGPPGGETARSR